MYVLFIVNIQGGAPSPLHVCIVNNWHNKYLKKKKKFLSYILSQVHKKYYLIKKEETSHSDLLEIYIMYIYLYVFGIAMNRRLIPIKIKRE